MRPVSDLVAPGRGNAGDSCGVQVDMTTNSRLRVTGLVVAIGALSLSGCGSTPRTPSSDPAQRASADATALLGSFRPPPGATRASGEPSAAPSLLDQPSTTPNTPDLVTKTRWWTTSAAPDSVVSWESTHLPKGMTSGGSGSTYDGSGQPPSELTVTFSAPPAPSVLPSRQLLVQAASTTDGRTVIRVDAQVTWLPARPASEAIPPAAVLTIRTDRPHDRPPALRVAHAAPATMTVTDRTLITQAANLIAALPVLEPGVRNCPADTGGSLSLTFASLDGAALAIVTASASGCGTVSVMVRGASQPELSGGPELIERLGSLLHVHWPELG